LVIKGTRALVVETQEFEQDLLAWLSQSTVSPVHAYELGKSIQAFFTVHALGALTDYYGSSSQTFERDKVAHLETLRRMGAPEAILSSLQRIQLY
jgi:hypothetical protein